MLVKLADFLAARIGALIAAKGEAWWQQCLNTEFGGMNEVGYNLYVLTAAPQHLRLAKFFEPDSFFAPLADGLRDPLDGCAALEPGPTSAPAPTCCRPTTAARRPSAYSPRRLLPFSTSGERGA